MRTIFYVSLLIAVLLTFTVRGAIKDNEDPLPDEMKKEVKDLSTRERERMMLL